MSEQNKYQVGQEVWLYENGRPEQKVPVIKVGRKLVTVESYGREKTFRIEDGSSNKPQVGFGSWIRTDAEALQAERRVIVIRGLRDHGFTHEGYGGYKQSTDVLERVLNVLNEEKK